MIWVRLKPFFLLHFFQKMAIPMVGVPMIHRETWQ